MVDMLKILTDRDSANGRISEPNTFRAEMEMMTNRVWEGSYGQQEIQRGSKDD
jgi:hypothetical protein